MGNEFTASTLSVEWSTSAGHWQSYPLLASISWIDLWHATSRVRIGDLLTDLFLRTMDPKLTSRVERTLRER